MLRTHACGHREDGRTSHLGANRAPTAQWQPHMLQTRGGALAIRRRIDQHFTCSETTKGRGATSTTTPTKAISRKPPTTIRERAGPAEDGQGDRIRGNPATAPPGLDGTGVPRPYTTRGLRIHPSSTHCSCRALISLKRESPLSSPIPERSCTSTYGAHQTSMMPRGLKNALPATAPLRMTHHGCPSEP
jgi:hypothetical protein